MPLICVQTPEGKLKPNVPTVGKMPAAGGSPQPRFTCNATFWVAFSFCIAQALML